MSNQPSASSDAAAFEAEVWRWVRQNFTRIEAKSEPNAKDLNAVRNLVLIGGALRGLATGRPPNSSGKGEPVAERVAETSPELAEMLAAMRAEEPAEKS